MTSRRRTRSLWSLRAGRRLGALGGMTTVAAVAAAAVVVAVGTGGTAAAARSGLVADRRVADAAVAVARALDALAAGTVAVLAGIVLAVLAGLLASLRTDEDALLRSRGATRGQRTRWGAAEGAVTGLVGGLVGSAVGTAVALLTGAGIGPLLPVATAAVAGPVVVATVSTALAAGRRPRAAAPAARTATLAVVTLLAVAAGGFAVWRLFVAGVPVRTVAGRATVDPVAVVAPLVVVVAGAVVVLLAGGLTARAVAATAGRWRRLLPALVARRVARGWSAVAPTVLVVGAVVASGVFVSGLAATVSAVDGATARAVVGPDVRITTPGDDVVDPRTPAVSLPTTLPGATAVVPTLTDEVSAGSTTVPLVAAPAAVAPSVLPGGSGRAVARLASDTPSPGVPLGDRARRLAVEVSIDTATLHGDERPDAVGSVALTAWVVDADGRAAEVPLRTASGDAVAVGSRAATSATLPTSGGPWRLLAVEPTVTFSSRPSDADGPVGAARLRVPVTVVVRASGAPDVVGRVTAVDLGDPVRIPLGARSAARTLPVVVSRALATRLGLATGDRLDLEPSSVRAAVHVRVAAVVPDVPGTGSTEAVAADLPALVALAVAGGPAIAGTDAGVPRVDETWIASSTPARTAAAVARSLPRGAHVTTADGVRSGPVVDTAVAALAAAAALGALLAALVLAVATARPDAAAPGLVGVGVPPRARARARAAEAGLPVVAAVVGGAVVGVVAVAVTAAPFAIAAVPDAGGLVTAAPVLVAPSSWALPLGTLLLAALVVAGLVVRTVRGAGAGS